MRPPPSTHYGAFACSSRKAKLRTWRRAPRRLRHFQRGMPLLRPGPDRLPPKKLVFVAPEAKMQSREALHKPDFPKFPQFRAVLPFRPRTNELTQTRFSIFGSFVLRRPANAEKVTTG